MKTFQPQFNFEFIMGERRDEMRCIVHVDLDCFYVQVERSKNPELKDVPCAVVQYNKWQGGGIIALSYVTYFSKYSRTFNLHICRYRVALYLYLLTHQFTRSFKLLSILT